MEKNSEEHECDISAGRKQADEALRESERRYRALFEKNRNPIAIIDLEGRYLDANPAFLEFTQKTRERLLQMRVFEFAPPGTKELQEIDHKPVWEAGGILETEYYIAGEIKILELTLTPIQYKGVDAILGTGRDVTAQKRMERCLLESRRRLDEAQHLARIGNWSWDIESHELNWSDEVFRIFGVEPDSFEPSVEAFEAMIHPDDIAFFLDRRARMFEEKQYAEIDHRIVLPSGEIRHVQERARLIMDEGRVVRVIGTVQDITERKIIEEKLRESRKQLQEVCKLANIGVWDWIADTDTVVWSEELYRIAGRDPRLPAPTYAEHPQVYAPDSWERLQKAVNLTMTSGEPYELELEIVRPSGERRWVNIFGGLVVDRRGKKRGLHGTVQDTTERKRSEKERTRLESQKQKIHKAESLNRMAGAIAHRFNNHLAVVMGNLEMAAENSSVNENLAHNLDEAMKASKQAAEVSGMMLTYLGQMSGGRDFIDLSELCRKTVLDVRRDISESIRLTTDLPSPGPSVFANRRQIRQALFNLIVNAVESLTEDRQYVRLSAGITASGDIPNSHRFPVGWRPQKTLHGFLEVQDTGKGINEADIENLFDPFFSTQFTGRGLGLPVVIGVAQAHGGGVTVESEPGRGSVFRIFLPASEKGRSGSAKPAIYPESKRPEPHSETRSPEQSLTVLVADDEEMVRNVTEAFLKRLGFNVIKAGDGAEAVERFRKHRDSVDLVISDLSMPKMNGWETLAAIRKISPDIPVILSSGYDEAHAMKGEGGPSPQAFLKKPYSRRDLKAVLRSIPGIGNRNF